MKKVVIAFDVDGTLIRADSVGAPVANERIRTLLIMLASMKNTKIVVWSGGGEEYAKHVCDAIGVSHYVNQFATKHDRGTDEHGTHTFAPDITPDIAIDDMHACELGTINLIVGET